MDQGQSQSQNLPHVLHKIVGATFDVFSAACLISYALLLGPLGVLRGPLALERVFWYLWVLIPQKLLSRSVRAAIDWRLGHFDAAIVQWEGIIATCEEDLRRSPHSQSRRRVLADLYTLQARAFMHAGHIDDAMQLVIRAKKSLGLERLPGLAELDAKTAHLVRAGLAAGKLLDGNGLATMFVKSSLPETHGRGSSSSSSPWGNGEGHRGKPGDVSSQDPSRAGSGERIPSPEMGKLIPFPAGVCSQDAPRG